MKSAVINGINDVIPDKDCMWIISNELPCLFQYDYFTREIELKAIFPEEVNTSCHFSRMIKIENEIYFIPWSVKDIYYYDISKDELHKLDIPFKDFSSDGWRKTEAVVKNGNLYCINRIPDAIIEINSITKEAKIFQVDMQLYADRLLPYDGWAEYPNPCVYQEKIIWTNYKNILSIFDIRTKEFSMEEIEGVSEEPKRRSNATEDYIFGVRSFREALWLFTFEGRVYRYDTATHKIEDKSFEDYVYYDDDDGLAVCILYNIVPLENELFLVPSYKNKCIKYNGSTDQYEESIKDYTQSWEFSKRFYTICKVINGKKILFYSYNENIFYILDTEKNSVQKWKIEEPWTKFISQNPLFVQAVSKFCTRNYLYIFDDLDWLIQSVSVNDKKKEENLSIGIVGEQIYKTINNA